jgi:hypothetical protein
MACGGWQAERPLGFGLRSLESHWTIIGQDEDCFCRTCLILQKRKPHFTGVSRPKWRRG